jgi:phosphoglycolate phosphatase-like HAD superfamily hydrolase
MPGPAPLPLAVVDIDGVVADVRHRLHHVESRPKDWPAFFAAAAADPPLAEGVERVRALRADHEVVFLTGRPESLRRVTEAWLDEHGLGGSWVLMRRPRDFRPARVAKAEELRRLARGRTVAVVIDDDPEVCDALRSAGWPVEQATWVPHSRTLRAAQEREGRT